MASSIVLLVFLFLSIHSGFSNPCNPDLPEPPGEFINKCISVQMPTAGIFATTNQGLVAINLQTLDATVLVSEYTAAVAVNQKLMKVYWSEIRGNSRIMRSNFDGSTKELVVPQTGQDIYTLAVDAASDNIYYSLRDSNEIKVCNARGENCFGVISNSSVVRYPFSLVLDSDNGAMYWANNSPHALMRANMDGSNAAIISTDFDTLYGIAFEQRSSTSLYYADSGDNTIGTIDVDGGNKRTLVQLEDRPAPRAVQVDADKIYFGNYLGRTIQSVDRYSGGGLTTIFNSTLGVNNMALFSAPL